MKKQTYTVRFPSGHTAHELLHYMGMSDPLSLYQRPLIAQQLGAKCFDGKNMQLTPEELDQLIDEVDNAHNIKGDHVGDGTWSEFQQYNLGLYLKKLKRLRDTYYVIRSVANGINPKTKQAWSASSYLQDVWGDKPPYVLMMELTPDKAIHYYSRSAAEADMKRYFKGRKEVYIDELSKQGAEITGDI